MNKLGVYKTAQGFADLDSWNPRSICSMDLGRDFLAKLKARGVFTMGRVFFEDQRIDGNYWADFMLPKLIGLQDVLDCVMGPNEIAVWNPAEAMAYCRETKVWANRIRIAGFKTAAYSFSEGHPDLSLWPYLKGHGCDYLCLHEYDAPEMWRTEGYRCLRYRNPAIPKDKPIIIGECGIDGGVQGIDRPQTGWRGFGDAAHYAESLRWYRDEIAKDSYVLCAMIFAGNWNVGNGTFNIENVSEIRTVVNERPPEPQPVVKLTDIQRAQLVVDQSFIIQDIALAISFAENHDGNPRAVNTAGNNPPTSVDRGLWMINNKWHSEVSDDCAFDPVCSTKEAYRISKGGTDFSQWSTWDSAFNNYKEQLPRARAALKGTMDKILLAGIEAAKNEPHIAVNDQAWLFKFGVSSGAGFPEKSEKYFDFEGKGYIYQEWSKAHLLMEQNHNETARLVWK